MFIDRKSELAALKARLSSNKFELVVLYGRRRVGKTVLLSEALKGKGAIFYCGVKNNNLGKFKQAANLQHLADDWGVVFSALKDKIIVLDEFPYMLEEEPGIGAELQKAIDHSYAGSKTKLILCGSIISVLKESILDYNAPLYGRKTAQLKLRPIAFPDFRGFYPKARLEDIIKAYAFSGGVPQYARMVGFPFEKWLNDELAREDSLLQDEVEFLIKSEFKKEKSYFSILEAVAFGKNTFGEIKDHGHFKETDITPYISNLKYVDLLGTETPLFALKRDSRYYIKDWFIRFWFNFIYPFGHELGVKNYRIDGGAFNKYLGFAFEHVVRELFADSSFASLIGFAQEKFGRQWGRIPANFSPEAGKDQYEIDVVAIEGKTSRILFGECKWQENANAVSIAAALIDKARYVGWHEGRREESFAIFAKSFSRKITEFEGKPVKCIDILDLERHLK